MLKWLLDLFIETSRLCSLAGQYNCIIFTVLTNFFFSTHAICSGMCRM